MRNMKDMKEQIFLEEELDKLDIDIDSDYATKEFNNFWYNSYKEDIQYMMVN